MKHKYLSLAVLSLFSGMTMAATSVTLYGTAEIAYRDQTGDNLSLRQDAAGESRLGVKGQEDLGNGTAAFFQLESRYDLDTGANTGTAGNFGFTCTRPRLTMPMPLANKAEIFDWAQLGLPEIFNSSCLSIIVLCSTSTTGTVRGGGKIIHG